MKTTERFENAITKLYKAFHEGTLDAMDCKHCAVGNLCDNSEAWSGNGFFGYENRISETFNNTTGYSRKELSMIEQMFLFGSYPNECDKFENTISNEKVIKGNYSKQKQQELQFKGLCAVIEYLAELDNIPNPMDYSKLFETENDKLKYELSF